MLHDVSDQHDVTDAAVNRTVAELADLLLGEERAAAVQQWRGEPGEQVLRL